MHVRGSFAPAAAMLLSTVVLTGCVTSQSSRYERQLSAVVKPAGQPSPAVAQAFGLDERSSHDTAIAAADDQ